MAAEQVVRVVGPWSGAGLDRLVRALLLLLWFAARGGALYFHIGETEKKCFIEEIPDETMVIGAGGGGELGRRPWSWGAGCGRISKAAEPEAASLALSWRPRTRSTSRSSDLGSSRLPPGNYRTQLYDKQREEYQPATPGLGMFVEVKDPEDKVSRPLNPAELSALDFSARPIKRWYFPS